MSKNKKSRLIGLKQSRKAIREGRATKVYVAMDVEDRIRLPLLALCDEFGVPTEIVPTMKELGALGGIDVSASVIAELD